MKKKMMKIIQKYLECELPSGVKIGTFTSSHNLIKLLRNKQTKKNNNKHTHKHKSK